MDELILHFMNFLARNFGVIVTPILRLVSILGEKGIVFLAIGFVLMLNKKTRWIGISIWISLALGFVINSLFIKNIIMRERPYMSSNPDFYKYWEHVGAIKETGYSMPSGHTLAASTCMMTLFLTCKKSEKKKYLILYFVTVSLMAFSRMYFMHHYFTDCLIGALLGVFMACIGKIITKEIYKFCDKNKSNKICDFLLNFDFVGMND